MAIKRTGSRLTYKFYDLTVCACVNRRSDIFFFPNISIFNFSMNHEVSVIKTAMLVALGEKDLNKLFVSVATI